MNHIRATARGRLALAGAAFALGLLAPAISRAACQIKRMELPVRMVGQRAIATLGINGTPVPLIVDSGAFFSMLSDAAAAQLHLPTQPLPPEMRVVGLAGKVQARLTTVNRLRIGQGEIPDADFIVGGNEPGAGAMGLLGRNVLSFIDTEYDLAHGVIRLVLPNADCDDANMAYWAGDTPVAELALPHPFRENNPEIRARIELNGHKVDAVFDTGASTIVSLDAAPRRA